ncbi:MAG: flagellar motor switch phosphatase FliY [Lachnospiraceae bacterium]|nr:flagellar motor switch phosphatase FliY [Lachnospiraceae bacterium]
MDGMLSQEEINALLSGMSDDAADTAEAAPQSGPSVELSEQERDAVGEISNICMGTAATTLSTLLNNRVVITTPSVTKTSLSELSSNYDRPCVFVQISYIEGLEGNNILILQESDVKIITDLMMGGDGTNLPDELSELHLSAISEAMNQMMGSASTSLSSMLDKKVDISPPIASLIDLNDSVEEGRLSSFLQGDFIQVAFHMEIGDLIDSQIMQLYPFDFAKELYRKFSGDEQIANDVAPAQSAPEPVAQQEPQPAMQQPAMDQQNVAPQPTMQQASQPMMQQPMMQQPMMQPDVNVQPAQFQAFNAAINPIMQQENIDLIMDVPLEVTVELGRTNKTIKEILDFSPGTIIELNKLAGEPIDVLVNGKFVAKGEVVVIEESFGIRVTEIIR